MDSLAPPRIAPESPADVWAAARDLLDGLPGGGLNIAHEAVRRHVTSGRGNRIALRFHDKQGEVTTISYAELDAAAARFANVLRAAGVVPGEPVFFLMGRSPELYASVLGALAAGNVVCPLFSAFGPEPVRQRLLLGHGAVLVTTAGLYRRKVAPVRAELPDLRIVFVVGDDPAPDDTHRLAPLTAAASPDFAIEPTRPETAALLHFTSGTTGTPKGAVHVHEAVVAHHLTARRVLDLHEGDVYWCTADPGWVTGTSYGIIGPLTCGVTMVVDEAEFDARRWYEILVRDEVAVWYTAPTAIRMLMKAGDDLARAADLSKLRWAFSVGEPLNPEAVAWGRDVLGHAFRDSWWQTETGGIMIASSPELDVRPGSMGRPIPGVVAGLLATDDQNELVLDPEGHVTEIDDPTTVGMVALRPGWPSMFRAYLDAEERYRKCFVDGWYLSGDLARRDEDGYYWFVGRADDVIKTAGHLIGPFEVESVLMEHRAIAEAGVYGVPDPVAGAIVHASIVLKRRPGEAPPVLDDVLLADIVAHARRRLGPAVAPRSIVAVDDLPKTRSGKIMRRVLRARELGLPEGDLSTLENGSA